METESGSHSPDGVPDIPKDSISIIQSIREPAKLKECGDTDRHILQLPTTCVFRDRSLMGRPDFIRTGSAITTLRLGGTPRATPSAYGAASTRMHTLTVIRSTLAIHSGWTGTTSFRVPTGQDILLMLRRHSTAIRWRLRGVTDGQKSIPRITRLLKKALRSIARRIP